MYIRDAVPADLPALVAIYNQAVRSSAATFDLVEQTVAQRTAWFGHYGPRHPLLVAELDGAVVGYCSLSRFREKPAYDRTVESSVYVDGNHRRRGIGRALMEVALARAAAIGHHVVVAGITAGNDASVRLHRDLGFESVGCLREVGRKFDRWQDVWFYQRILADGGDVQERSQPAGGA